MKWNEKLIELRGDKTIGEVADAINASPDTYMAYERGERMPMPTVRMLIAEYFHVSENEIFAI